MALQELDSSVNKRLNPLVYTTENTNSECIRLERKMHLKFQKSMLERLYKIDFSNVFLYITSKVQAIKEKIVVQLGAKRGRWP